MDTKELAFFVLLAVGILLMCIEIFVPGGVLGGLGVAALVGAIILAFIAFPNYAALIAILIILGLGLALVLWVKFFPKSGLGRQMTLERDGKDFKATEDSMPALIGLEGDATSDLRPGGFALLGGKRIDVVSEGEHIKSGTRIKVVNVEGNRVVVRRI